jgi:uncharacterized membrane protein YhaH (DUF805 family)
LVTFDVGIAFVKLLSLVSVILSLLFSFIQVVKRMHDVDKSGWYFFVPIYGSSFILKEGTIGENEYGEDPKKEDRLKL